LIARIAAGSSSGPAATSRTNSIAPWGFDRSLWGTDWTRAFAVVNYEQAVESFLGRVSDSERATLMGGACAKAYGWSPKKVSAFSAA
jgi:predicted TIM-barrel fold metal-dependent hydrolase